jgi:hypothetical protein
VFCDLWLLWQIWWLFSLLEETIPSVTCVQFYSRPPAHVEARWTCSGFHLHNTKTVLWRFRRMFVGDTDLLCCCAVWLGNCLPKFRRNVSSSSSGYESINGLATLKMKAVSSFETSGCHYPTTERNNADNLLLQYNNRFANDKIF